MLPIWVYFVVAVAIALTAFAIAQLVPGLGVAFVALASTLWTAYAASRYRTRHQGCRAARARHSSR